MTPASVRPLTPADLDAVVAIDKAITGRSRKPFFEKRVAAVQDSATGALGLVALESQAVAGFVFADVLDGEFGVAAPVGVLGALGVAPKAQGHHLGTQLLAGLVETLKTKGVERLRTETEWSDALTHFFSTHGFTLANRLVLERDVQEPLPSTRADDTHEHDESAPAPVVVRSMNEGDLAALVRIDQKITGRDRTPYYRRKSDEVLKRSGVRVSLVAEVDGRPAGFAMARVDLGDFGRTEPTAVLDTLGVNPDFRRHHVGQALLEQLVLNLRSLRVERAVTQVEWGRFDLIEFLASLGFKPSQRLALDRSTQKP